MVGGIALTLYEHRRHFGDLVFRVPVSDTRGFIGKAVDLPCEPSRLEDTRHWIEERGAELPRWNAVLANEIAELDREAPSPGFR